jgi:hypothetical protein
MDWIQIRILIGKVRMGLRIRIRKKKKKKLQIQKTGGKPWFFINFAVRGEVKKSTIMRRPYKLKTIGKANICELAL